MLKKIWYFISKLEYPANVIATDFIACAIFVAGFYLFLKGGIPLIDHVTLGFIIVVGIAVLIGAVRIIRFIIKVVNETHDR